MVWAGWSITPADYGESGGVHMCVGEEGGGGGVGGEGVALVFYLFLSTLRFYPMNKMYLETVIHQKCMHF